MHKRNIFILLIFFVNMQLVIAQTENKFYLGAGNSENITVTTSDNWQPYLGSFWATGQKTIDGSGLNGPRVEAVRFLAQATFGGTTNDVEEFIELGSEDWLKQQFNLPSTNLSDTVQLFYNIGLANWVTTNGDSTGYPTYPFSRHVSYAWWNNMINAKDQLRQRMAYALSEILVVSLNTGHATSTANYYDLLIENAFGNYRDLLEAVSLSPTMGIYLSHLNNPKTDTASGSFPDENYAREIMQLFSIGIYKMNNDGTLVGAPNNLVPTYTNEHIKELAKVFTGLGVGATKDTSVANLYFGYNNRLYFDYTVPMIMYDNYHEQGDKIILDDYVIPAGQTGMEDVNQAIDYLFNHPNVGPFLASRLIQHFVKSNPSPEYIDDVANVFNDNGNGIRGDLKAVITAILLHPEARDCDWINHSQQGKLREPILRYTQFARFFNGEYYVGSNRFWNSEYRGLEFLNQYPLFSPTVFNFFKPGYIPSGPLSDNGLVGPEYEIHTTSTSIGYADFVYLWVEAQQLAVVSVSDITGAPLAENVYNPHFLRTDLTSLGEISKDTDALLDYLDVYFCNGQLSNQTRNLIKSELDMYSASAYNGIKMKLALYIIMLSPDYVVLK